MRSLQEGVISVNLMMAVDVTISLYTQNISTGHTTHGISFWNSRFKSLLLGRLMERVTVRGRESSEDGNTVQMVQIAKLSQDLGRDDDLQVSSHGVHRI